MAHLSSFSSAADGTKIHIVIWPVERPKAVLALVHGLGEHALRYAHLAAFFNAQGYAVCAYDRRGHGLSGGKRGHTPSYEALLDEIELMFAEAGKSYPTEPVFLYGHSMGGNIALNFLLRRQPKLAGLISSAAWIQLAFEPPAAMIALGKAMRRIWPSLQQPNGLDVNGLSRDGAVVEAYRRDPLVHNKISAEMGMAMLEAAQHLAAHSGPAPVPMLLMHGDADAIISPTGTQRLSERLSGDATLKIWKGLYHEIHNEPEQQAVFEFTLDWMDHVLVDGPLPPA